MDKLAAEVKAKAKEEGIQLAKGEQEIDDVLTYALFPQIGLKFLQNRGDASAFEPVPTLESAQAAIAPKVAAPANDSGVYTVKVNGQAYVVEVAEGGDVTALASVETSTSTAPAAPAPAPSNATGVTIDAPLAGNIFKILVKPGEDVEANQVVIIMEAMKMETEIRAVEAGTVGDIAVREGDAVQVGDTLLTL